MRILLLLLLVTSAYADDLESALKDVQLDGGAMPAGIVGEKLYAVHSRLRPLSSAHEISVGGGRDVTSSGFINSNQMSATYRFHFSDRFSLGLFGSYVGNTLTQSGEMLVNDEKRIPDISFAKYRLALLPTVNILYGKVRASVDSALHFDLYAALGPGFFRLSNNDTWAAVADVGLAFWFGRTFTMRLGVQDYIFFENRMVADTWVNQVVPHLDIGIVLGGAA